MGYWINIIKEYLPGLIVVGAMFIGVAVGVIIDIKRKK